MAGAMAFTACNKELDYITEEPEEAVSTLRHMTFTAGPEGQATKAAIDGLDIKWSTNDKVAVFDGSDLNFGNQAFELTAGAGTTCGVFEGEAAEASNYFAMYPYIATYVAELVPSYEEACAAAGTLADELEHWQMYYEFGDTERIQRYMDDYEMSAENQAIIWAWIKGESLTVKSGPQRSGDQFDNIIIPVEQMAVAGSADPAAMLMLAKSSDGEAFEFKNVCSFVKITPQFDCYAIGLKSKAGQSLAGNASVDFSGDVPSATVVSDGADEVFLVGNIKAGNAYYIAVCPGSLSGGFTVEFLTADKSNYYARSTNKSLSLTRSHVADLGEFTASGIWTYNVPTAGTDANGHSWQLVTPDFKMATAFAGVDVYANAVGRWGDDWVLLTADEAHALLDNNTGLINFDYTSYPYAVVVGGVGILKYLNPFRAPFDSAWCWTSTAIDASYHVGFNLGGSFYNAGDIYADSIWYKYIG